MHTPFLGPTGRRRSRRAESLAAALVLLIAPPFVGGCDADAAPSPDAGDRPGHAAARPSAESKPSGRGQQARPRRPALDVKDEHDEAELIQLAFDSQVADVGARSAARRAERRYDEAAREVPTRGLGLGRRLPDLAFTDVDGVPGRISDLAGPKALVLLVRDTGCPVSRRFGPHVAALERRFADRSVALLYLYQGAHESLEEVREDLERNGCEARAILDEDERFGPELGIRTTAEAFVFDRARTLVYRGAVDDRLGRGVVRDAPDREYLVEAVDAVLAGRRVEVEATTAPGCLLLFGEPETAGDAAPPVTYHGEVSRIVQRNCEVCHRDGAVAPFPLTTYEDLVGRRGMVRFVVEGGIMPPWFADEESGPWRNDVSLSERDRADMLAWIEAGCPEGDPSDAPLPIPWHEPGTWSIGEPDLVLQIPEPIAIPAEGFLDYQRRAVEIPLDEDRWIQKLEFLPTAPEVVHHVGAHLFTADGKRHALQGWVPGQRPTVFPDGMALFLPHDATLLLTIHYTPLGEATEDQLRLGFVFADEPPVQEALRVVIADRRFVIPAHHPDFPVTAELVLKQPTLLRHLMPHMHLRGSSFLVEAILPDGERKHLLELEDWDFDWQLTYEFADPVLLPTGTRLVATGRFDNSRDNPANPDPTRDVPYGRQTDSEMMTLGLELLLAGDG